MSNSICLKKRNGKHTVSEPRPAAVVAAIKAVQLLQDLPWLLGGGCIVQVDQADARLHLQKDSEIQKSHEKQNLLNIFKHI